LRQHSPKERRTRLRSAESHPSSATAAALSHQLGVRVADDKELLAADVVFIATPPAALDDVAAALKGYAGIIVSAMVPGAGGYELKQDDGTSATEQLARLVPKPLSLVSIRTRTGMRCTTFTQLPLCSVLAEARILARPRD
jgi:predicted dinucleotide-binding enzyme